MIGPFTAAPHHDVLLLLVQIALLLFSARAMARDRHNPTYLPEAILPDALHITSDLAHAAQDKSLWVIATPSHAVRALAEALRPFTHPDLIVVSVGSFADPSEGEPLVVDDRLAEGLALLGVGDRGVQRPLRRGREVHQHADPLQRLQDISTKRQFKAGEADIDPETRKQLEALGYFGE